MIRRPEPTPDLAVRVVEATARLGHVPSCKAPDPIATVGTFGDEMVRCWTCGRFELLTPTSATLSPPDAPPAPVPAPLPVVAVVAVVGGWRCRDHDRVVTWRGCGCRDCQFERRARDRDREQARREAAARRAKAAAA